jgi:hypothetical protein
MKVVGVVFIATNHFLAVAHFLPTVDSSLSVPAHQPLKSMVSSNNYINGYRCIKCVVRC